MNPLGVRVLTGRAVWSLQVFAWQQESSAARRYAGQCRDEPPGSAARWTVCRIRGAVQGSVVQGWSARLTGHPSVASKQQTCAHCNFLGDGLKREYWIIDVWALRSRI